MDTEKEIKQFQKRLLELASKSYQQDIYTYTGFLGLPEQDILHRMEKELFYAGITLYGGSEQAERQIARFGKAEENGYTEEFPIALLKIEPLMQKFADTLTHRDFLGALMNLGLERSTLGDIFIQNNNGYLYCLNSVADFIIDELSKIKHTNVKCSFAELSAPLTKQEMTEQILTVSSERADAVLAGLYHISRAQSLNLFRAEKIYINGRLCENNGCNLKKGDIVTVRGKGKFVYDGTIRETKKGRLCVHVNVYG